MCVVDRRYEAGDAMLALQQQDYTSSPQHKVSTSTSSTVTSSHEEKEEKEEEEKLERQIHGFPAPMHTEGEDMVTEHPKGVACIVETPGLEALVTSMLSRIWGASELT